MNFYKYVHDARILNREAQINDFARYMSFIDLSNFLRDDSLSDNSLNSWCNQ